MNINRNNRVSSIALLLAGFNKHCAKTGGLIVNSETLKPKDVAACLQAVVDSVRGVAEARGAFKAALADEQRVAEENADVITAVKQMVMNAFGNKPDVLADFGLEKRARKQRTVSEKFDAVGKTLATRSARHTLGRKQKARADFHEPRFPVDLADVVELSAVA